MNLQECELELERIRRVLTATTAELAGCLATVPSPLLLDVQYVLDGVSLLLVFWGLMRFAWDLRHRRPDMFPVDR